MTLAPGDTIHIPDTGPPHDKGKSHLFVMLTKPCGNERALLVPMCRIRSKFDDTCKLAPGEHAFVEEASYIAYHFLMQFNVVVLEKQIANGILRPNDPVNSGLLARICDGVLKSRHSPPIEKKYYQERLNDAAKKNEVDKSVNPEHPSAGG